MANEALIRRSALSVPQLDELKMLVARSKQGRKTPSLLGSCWSGHGQAYVAVASRSLHQSALLAG